MTHKKIAPENLPRPLCKVFAFKKELNNLADGWGDVDCPHCLSIKETLGIEE